MKKSEMINALIEWDKASEPQPTTDRELISIILDKLVELGMYPPALPGKSVVKMNSRCKWEAE